MKYDSSQNHNRNNSNDNNKTFSTFLRADSPFHVPLFVTHRDEIPQNNQFWYDLRVFIICQFVLFYIGPICLYRIYKCQETMIDTYRTPLF